MSPKRLLDSGHTPVSQISQVPFSDLSQNLGPCSFSCLWYSSPGCPHRLLLSSIQLLPKASEYRPGAPPPYPSSIQHSWSPALFNSFSEASNTSLKRSIYSPCPSTRCKFYDVWLRTVLHKQLLRKWVKGWMKDEWMKEGMKITIRKFLPSETPSWQHGLQQQADHWGFRTDPLSPIPLPAFFWFPASFCHQWGPCVLYFSSTFFSSHQMALCLQYWKL